MTLWQRRARLVIAVGGIAFAIVVVFALKRRDTAATPPPPPRDSDAIVEVTGGRIERFKFAREDVRVAYERQLTFANGSTRLMGVAITSDERAGGRSFTVQADEASVGENESTLQLTGNVRLAASDGMTVRTDHATYSDMDGIVRSAGAVEFTRGRMTGSGVGMTYDTKRDVLSILDRSMVHVAADEKGAGAVDISSMVIVFARPDKNVRFESAVDLRRDGQTLQADVVTAYLTPDENQIQKLELRRNARIAMAMAAPGGLQTMTGRDIDLTYAPGGETLERAVLVGGSAIVLAGTATSGNRQITADTMDVGLAPDGTTPVKLTARDSVVLTLPAEQTLPQRTIESAAMDASGEPGAGLTRAQFRGDVEYHERRSGENAIEREASAAVLDVALKPAMAGIREAKFARGVHFVDGSMTSDAAEARYDLDKGVLELTGTEPRMPRPRVTRDRLAVDANRIDVTLDGPNLNAVGMVKSVVQPVSAGRGRAKAPAASETRVPSMFKQDRPVNITANQLDYNGTGRTATYTGNAQLWQEETSLKGATIVVDERTGDLAAKGEVTTATVRDVVRADKKAERVRSIATAADFRYEEAGRRAIYTGAAHMNSSDGDVTASRIELYLKPEGVPGSLASDDVERAEAYDEVTLRDQNRTTTGARLTYTTADQKYVVTGTPVKIVDECGRETIGRTLTYLKSTETITIDGNEKTRTQTKGSGQCQ